MYPIPIESKPQQPRAILASAILPYFVTEPLTRREVAVEKIIHKVEVEATRPSWQRALAGALLGLQVAS